MQEKLGRRALFIGVSRKKDEVAREPDPLSEDLDQILRTLDALAEGEASTRVSGIPPGSMLLPLAKRLDHLAVRMQSDMDLAARYECIIKTFPLPCAVYRQDGSPVVTNRAFDEQAAALPVPSAEEIREGADGEETVRTATEETLSDGKEHHYRRFRTAVPLPDGSSEILFVWDNVTPLYERIHELENARKTEEETRGVGASDEHPVLPSPVTTTEELPSSGPEGTPPVVEESDERESPPVPEEGNGSEETAPTPSPVLSDEVTEVVSVPEPPDEDDDALLVASILQSAGFSTGTKVTAPDSQDKPAPADKEPGGAVPAEEPMDVPESGERTPGTILPAEDSKVEDEQQIESEIEVVEFSLGQEAYAIDICLAREIVEMMTITPIPRAPPYLAGVLNLRGEITNIITITTILGVSSAFSQEDQKIIVLSSEAAGGENVGIIVDDVRSVSQIPRERIERLGEGVGGKTRTNIKGIIKKEDRDGDRKDGSPEDTSLVLWLDLKKVLHELMNQ
jgi:purine-binding chemotaxis protein CheW